MRWLVEIRVSDGMIRPVWYGRHWVGSWWQMTYEPNYMPLDQANLCAEYWRCQYRVRVLSEREFIAEQLAK
jgi:hypothetical protein